MIINTKGFVKVKLTVTGLAELERKIEDQNCEFEMPKTDENGYSIWRLSDLIYEFGYLFTCGDKRPFQEEIIYLGENNNFPNIPYSFKPNTETESIGDFLDKI